MRIEDKGCWDENPRPKWNDGTPANSKFITQVFEEYDISKGEFPITNLRPTAVKTGIKEILWIYQEQSNSLKKAREMGVTWWDSWDVGDGTIGKRYGYTVKKHFLITNIFQGLQRDPFGRRHIMNLYQYDDLSSPGLYPCAYETLWSCRKADGEMYIDLTLVQRSNDYIAAGYINKIQYVALQMMVAAHLGYKVGKFAHLVQNLHIYDRHFWAINELYEKAKTIPDIQPKLFLKNTEGKTFWDFTADDFEVTDCGHIESLSKKLEIAV